MKYLNEFGLFIDNDCIIYSVNKDGKLYATPIGKGGRNGMYCKVAFYPVDENGVRGKKQRKAFVHRIVATAFVPNPEHKPTVDHINRDGHDNRPSNLRWATVAEQQRNRGVCDICEQKYGIHSYEDIMEYRKRVWQHSRRRDNT